MTLRISVLAGAAIGIASALYFLGLAAGLNPYIPFVVSIAVCVALARWFRTPAPEAPSKPPAPILRGAFLLVLATAAVIFVIHTAKQSHGDWDAFSIWNLHARFMERGGPSDWNAMFSKDIVWTHGNYPLLISAFIAQIWSVIRSETILIPQALAFVFLFATAGVLVGTLRILRGWTQALIAGTFLLATGYFVFLSAVQYADVPLGFYILASLALLCFDDARCIVLAGAMAGFAAWTKNEGLLFLILLVVSRIVVRLKYGGIVKLFSEFRYFIAGLAPVLAVVAFFKFHYAPAEELVAHGTKELLARATDSARFWTVLSAFGSHLMNLGFNFGTHLVAGILILAVYAWLVRFKIPPQQKAGTATAMLTVLLMLVGDFFVYVLFPNDLEWQIGTSLDRVLMQLWPALLLAFFSATSTIELEAAPPPQRKKAATGRRH